MTIGERVTIRNGPDFLRQVSVPVEFGKDDIPGYVAALKEYCENNLVFAMAAVQIGLPKRMIYVRNTTTDMNKNKDNSYNEAHVLINPEIVGTWGRAHFIERCESCLDYTAEPDRPFRVEVEYYDVNGNKIRETFEGFKALVFCHEFDHLNGILHIDLVDKVGELTWEALRDYRADHPYTVEDETCVVDYANRPMFTKDLSTFLG